MLYHCTALANIELHHQLCAKGEENWCKWQVSKITNAQYMPKINIPKWIHGKIRPIFLDLSKDELLAKCLHEETQNNNESLNNMIWARCPKNVFVTKTVLQLGVNSAVIEFNEGATGVIRVLEKVGIDIGKETVGGTAKKKTKKTTRIKRMNLKTLESTK